MSIPPAVRYVATVLGLAAALTILSLATKLLQHGGSVSLIYPLTGIGAALLWGFGIRWWPAVVIAQFLISLQASHSVWVATLIAATELLVILLFCTAVLRFRVSRD